MKYRLSVIALSMRYQNNILNLCMSKTSNQIDMILYLVLRFSIEDK